MKNKPAPSKTWMLLLPLISLSVALMGVVPSASSQAPQAQATTTATGAFRIPF